MKTYEINMTYGSHDTECTVMVAEDRSGGKWYVVCGSRTANYTYDELFEGGSVEELSDDDCFTTQQPMETFEDFLKHLED